MSNVLRPFRIGHQNRLPPSRRQAGVRSDLSRARSYRGRRCTGEVAVKSPVERTAMLRGLVFERQQITKLALIRPRYAAAGSSFPNKNSCNFTAARGR